MSQISDIQNPWRDVLLSMPASFRGVIFHVETGSRASGRRVVDHQYPKRNPNYAEDMGRNSRNFNFSGYLIYRPSNPMYQYTIQRQRLVKALEDDDAGMLMHPVFCQGGLMVMVKNYSMTESREKGGFTQFEMQFVEAGVAGNSLTIIDTIGNVTGAATSLNGIAMSVLNTISSGLL